VTLLVGDREEHALAEPAVGAERRLVGGSTDDAHRLHARTRLVVDEELPREGPDDAIDVGCAQHGRQLLEHGVRDLRELPVVLERPPEVLARPGAFGDDRAVQRKFAGAEVPRPTGSDHRRTERDGRDVTLADRPQRDHDPEGAFGDAGLIGIRDDARVAQGGPLDGVLRGERRPEHKGEAVVELGRTREHLGRVGPDERHETRMPRREVVREELRGGVDLRAIGGEHPLDDLLAPRRRPRGALPRQEQVGDDA
jgi:hypothetical protein